MHCVKLTVLMLILILVLTLMAADISVDDYTDTGTMLGVSMIRSSQLTQLSRIIHKESETFTKQTC